jgi:hypothetical protein|tara:strand:- start:1156 stop:1887 length:732 start_codon:yes stop_codon:yes gene_type:complete
MVDAVEIRTEETTAENPVEQQQQSAEKILGKFETQEDLIKSYQELEKKLGSTGETGETAEPKEEKSSTLEIDEAEQVVADAGLDMSQLQEQYDSNGTLDETSFEALEKAGIPKSYVEAFIQGQEALSNQLQTTIKSEVGGDESYAELMSWAKDALNPAEITAYNNVVNSRDLEAVKLAVTGLKARYETLNGVEPTLTAGRASTTGANGYNSWAQVTAAMKDARYESDSAFRAEVQDKISRSNL